MSRSGPPVLVRREEAALVITLNRPSVRNAIDAATSGGVSRALDLAEADEGIRVVVLTGSGSVFSAGADLRSLAGGRSVLGAGREADGFAGITRRSVGVPLIAALNGPAVGGGAEIALACDLLVATRCSYLAFPEVHRAIVPAAGGPLRLARRLPRPRALQALLTGERVPAEELLRWGLAADLAEPEDLIATALGLAEQLAAPDADAVAAVLALVRAAEQETPDWWQLSAEVSERVRSGTFAREGAAAFLGSAPGP